MARGSSSLGWILAAATGAALGILVSRRDNGWLPSIGRKGHLSGATPLPAVEVALGTELWEAGHALRQKVLEVPAVIRQALGFAPIQIQFTLGLNLGAFDYQLRLRGLNVGCGSVKPDHLFATREHGDGTDDLPGEVARDPRSGGWGIWIAPQDTGRAHLLGYHTLDAAFVMALHIDTLLRRHLFELLTREETYRLLDGARRGCPRTVDEVEKHLSVGLIQAVLQNLLREQVSLVDLSLVLELLSDASREVTTADALTEQVRAGLARQISAAFADEQGRLHALPFEPHWDEIRNMKSGDAAHQAMLERLGKHLEQARAAGTAAVLIAPGSIRSYLRRLIQEQFPDLPVLATSEVAAGYELVWLSAQLV